MDIAIKSEDIKKLLDAEPLVEAKLRNIALERLLAEAEAKLKALQSPSEK